MPAWVWADAVLTAAAQRLAGVHDATVGFDVQAGAWQLPVHQPVEVICHNDFAPYNLVLDDNHTLAGVIDWDTASPGPRVWDVAYLAYRLVPLSDPANPDGLGSDLSERRRRLVLLCQAYTALARPLWPPPRSRGCTISPTSPPPAPRQARPTSPTTSSSTATTPPGSAPAGA